MEKPVFFFKEAPLIAEEASHNEMALANDLSSSKRTNYTNKNVSRHASLLHECLIQRAESGEIAMFYSLQEAAQRATTSLTLTIKVCLAGPWKAFRNQISKDKGRRKWGFTVR